MKRAEIGPTNESDCEVIVFNIWDHDTTSEDDFLGHSFQSSSLTVVILGCVYVAVGGVCQKGVGEHELVLDLGASAKKDLRTKTGVKITGQIVIRFQVEEITT